MTDPEYTTSVSAIRDLVVRLRGYGSVLLPGSATDSICDDLNAAADLLDDWEDLRCGECNTVYPAPTCPDCANVYNGVSESHPLLTRFLRRD